jgi:hypothetical protein
MTRFTRAVAFALLLALVGSGCVTLRSSPPRFHDPWPPTDTGQRPAIALTVTGHATENGVPRDIGPILDPWGAATDGAYRESGLFAAVTNRGDRGDLRVDVELGAEVWQYEALTVFSYLTLLIIPHVVTTDITVTTRVTAANGRPLGTVQLRGRSQTWYQLPLLLLAGFFEPANVTPGIVYDLNRQSITELHARGLF